MPHKKLNPTFWQRLQVLRSRVRTATQVSKETGIHIMTVTGWERGAQPKDPANWRTLMEIYNLSADDVLFLLGITDKIKQEDDSRPSRRFAPVVRRDTPGSRSSGGRLFKANF